MRLVTRDELVSWIGEKASTVRVGITSSNKQTILLHVKPGTMIVLEKTLLQFCVMIKTDRY